MAKTQPKIDDIKDLKKATDVSDGLMSKEDKIKLDDLDTSDYDTAYTHSQSTHAPTDALTNRTIKVEGEDKAGSATTIPLNFKSGDGVINIVGQMDSGILDIIFSSVNTLVIYGALDPQDLRNAKTGVHELIEGSLYSFTPNPVCGTDTDSDSLFGKLIVLENIDGISKTLYYHSYKTNKVHVCSGYYNGSTFVWSNWERLLTCRDNNEIPDDLEGEGYLYQINSSYQRIILNSEDIKGKTVEIDLKLFRSQIGAKLRIIIEFDNVVANPDINIIDSTNPTKMINYSVSYYTAPTSVANVYRVEYEIYNFTPYWFVSNEIY